VTAAWCVVAVFLTHMLTDGGLKLALFFFQFKIMLLKKDEHSKASLLTNLRKINTHLVSIFSTIM
jgi:hypothetical protein